MLPIHLSPNLKHATKTSHEQDTAQQRKDQKERRRRQARAARAFKRAARLDLLTMPHTRLAEMIAENFNVIHISRSKLVVVALFATHSYPETYYVQPNSRIPQRTEQPHQKRLPLNTYAIRLHQRYA
jgi:hypothetical protein